MLSQQNTNVIVFPLEEYLHLVRTNHPVIKQAGLLSEKANAVLLESRGLFDPKWSGDYEHKSFDDKNYFRTAQAGLKIPTWYGIDVKLGYHWANGEFLNQDATLPQNGQAVVGVDIPLLQGLFYDQRRAQVEQARLVGDASEATQRKMVNDLLLAAVESYWEWAYHYEVMKILETSVSLAQERFGIVRESFLQGDKPAIDTLESLIVIENRKQLLSQAIVEYQNTTLNVSNYLWQEGVVPLVITSAMTPENLSTVTTLSSLDTELNNLDDLIKNHPVIQELEVKQQQLAIKESLKKEQFKPDLRFNYNFLGNGFNLAGKQPDVSAISNIILENYKLGFRFSYPLLLRKERGVLQQVKLEQLDNEYKINYKTFEIQNKIKSIFQLLNTTSNQQKTQTSIALNFQTLLDAENEKFRIGESSIFLLNNREQKLIEAKMKLIKLNSRLQKLVWKLEWTKGNLA